MSFFSSSSSADSDKMSVPMSLEVGFLPLGAHLSGESDLGSSIKGYSNIDDLFGFPDLGAEGSESSLSKRTLNVTEWVPVPTSEHVAEIVGRQGCKIKALRAKTNTYIKTPIRAEEPVFVVTGRIDDVALAKKEILSAAEHFSNIRALRRQSSGSLSSSLRPPNVPGQVTIQVPVAFRVVGLVVGPKGATIKRIQQETNTYILTPSRLGLPVFTIMGLPDQVELARQEIILHIEMRTGVPYYANLPQGYTAQPPLRVPSYVPTLNSEKSASFDSQMRELEKALGLDTADDWSDQFIGASGLSSKWSSDSSQPFESITSGLRSLISRNSIGSSRASDNGSSSPSPPCRPGSQLGPFGLGTFDLDLELLSPPRKTSAQEGVAEASGFLSGPGKRTRCTVCMDAPIVAILVPCGHNLFCYSCAHGICERGDGCPACHQPATQAIRVISL